MFTIQYAALVAIPVRRMQDLPPKQGFNPLNYKRNLPSKGPSGAVLLTGVTGMICFGLYLHRKSVHIRMELDREKIQARLNLMPLLQAEGDRETLRQEAKLLELQRRAEEMGYEGARESVYHDKKNYIKSSFLL